MEIAGSKVPLQRIAITLPPGAGVGGITFVLRRWVLCVCVHAHSCV